MAADLPTGTVTFLFTDIEGSTRLLQELGADRYAVALGEHRRVIRAACEAYGGVEMGTAGDAFFVAFPTASGALAAATEMTDELAPGPIHVRIGLHTGAPLLTDEGYVGDDLHLVARIAATGHGGQILVSAATAAVVAPSDPIHPAAELRDLGEHRLKDIPSAVSIFQIGDNSFPPLKTISNSNIPHPASSFVGRERELAEVLAHLAGGVRLLTLTGAGGSGKTRLAIEAALAVIPDYKAGVFWVGLDTLRDPALVTGSIAQTLGAKDGLAAHIGEREMLLLIDNLEHVIGAAPELSGLVSSCPALTLIVTSRELLRVEGEVELSVPPLNDGDAVRLFCARAGTEPSDEIAELCQRLDSLPLAVELAAARTAALTPAQILERLSQRLDLLAGGRDAGPRRRTLRATIEWSYDLLTDDERRLIQRLSVFAGGCTLDAAENVAGADVDSMQSLVDKSLLRFSGGRFSMLDTIREFAGELVVADDDEAVRRRHRSYFVALARACAHQLHTAEEAAVSAQLARDYANVRAAVSYALEAREPDDVGRIVGALYPFLISHGNLEEVREWCEAALAARYQLSPGGLAEALVGGGEIARFSGDLERAIELKEELASAQGDLQRPNWRAATLADLCEIALDRGDLASARGYAERSAAAGGGARSTLCFAELALRVGDLRTAETDVLAALGDLEPGAFNHACGLEVLGEITRRSGEAERAGECFRGALRSFTALGDGGGIADCLDGLARLAVTAGDPLLAGRLHGGARRLREVRGRRPIRTDLPLPDVPDSARDEGRAMALEDVVEQALGDLP